MNGTLQSKTGVGPGLLPLPKAPQPAARSHLGGKISTFRMHALPVKVAVFCPKAALTAQEVDVLVYAHGLLNACSPVKNPPEGLITGSTFQLGPLVDASKRSLVVVVPLFDWNIRGFHFLGKPENLNLLLAECMQQLAKMLGRSVGLSRLILSGHSRGYDFLEPLARANADPQMKQGALAKLSEVWAFDTTYVCDPAAWLKWLQAKPALKITVYYRRNTQPTNRPVGTMKAGDALYAVQKQARGRLKVTQISAEAGEGHCEVPVQRLKEVLSSDSSLHQPSRESIPTSTHTATPQAGSAPGLRAQIVKAADAEADNWGWGTKQDAGPSTVVSTNVRDSVKARTNQRAANGQVSALAPDGCRCVATPAPARLGGGAAQPETRPAVAPAVPMYSPAPTAHPAHAAGKCAEDRCTSAYIGWMQNALKGVGFKLNVNGRLDDRTIGAILRFKKRVGLKTKEAYSGPTIESALVAAGAQQPPALTRVACGITPAQDLIPLLNKHRGDIPLEILLAWVQLESGRQLGSSTSLCERGYFQLHPGNTLDLKLNHDLIGTDKDYSVRAGIRLVNQCRKSIAALKVPANSEFYWRLVKLAHWIPSGPRKLFAVMRKNGVEPKDWDAIRSFVKKNDEALKVNFKGHRPSQGVHNVEAMFQQIQLLRKKQSSPTANAGVAR